MILNKSGFIINLIHINTNIPNLTVSRKLGGSEQIILSNLPSSMFLFSMTFYINQQLKI